ncbi:hypothetical protein L2E82_14378 [Cichorium intybus]|uniref:Uncharacterized protein n=1 Tax=Cichorium intybus TaxID=13427 RepID=A0ACB9F077_CICIN|nr:hypothetical protein L2E82_14378 [Cichorium intybus]
MNQYATAYVGNLDPQVWINLVNVFEVFLPQLLLYPNPSDPLNGDAAALMMQDRTAYEQKVKGICDHIIFKVVCVCGATNVLADDLLPNKTLRDTINRILESNNISAENGGSAFYVQDMESARCAPPQPKIQSLSRSAASKAEHDGAPAAEPPVSGKGKITKAPDVFEATYDSRTKKKKKKKVNMPNAAEMQWRAFQDFVAENYMMLPGPPYNPYWNSMQPGMDAFMGPYGGGMPPYMGGGYGLGPMDVPFGGGMFPQDPFGMSGLMMPPPFIPPQRYYNL